MTNLNKIEFNIKKTPKKKKKKDIFLRKTKKYKNKN